MRKLATFFLLLCLSGAQAGIINVTYTFADHTANPLNVSRLSLTPLVKGADYSGTNLSGRPLIYTKAAYPELTNGVFTVTNLVAGYAYRVEFSDSYGVNTFTNYFPPDLDDQTVDGNDYKGVIVSQTGGVVFGYYYSEAIASGTATNVINIAASSSISITTNSSTLVTPHLSATASNAIIAAAVAQSGTGNLDTDALESGTNTFNGAGTISNALTATLATSATAATSATNLLIPQQNVSGLRVYDDSDGQFYGPAILGGHPNNFITTGSPGTVVLGGITNTDSGATYTNASQARISTIAGGVGNRILGEGSEGSFIGAGEQLTIADDATHSVIVGGEVNTIHAVSEWSAIVGGYHNGVDGGYSFLGGGYENTNAGSWSTLVGGSQNRISGNYASITGGDHNTATGNYSQILGGQSNQVTAVGSSVLGSGVSNGVAYTVMLGFNGNPFQVRSNGNTYTAETHQAERLVALTNLNVGVESPATFGETGFERSAAYTFETLVGDLDFTAAGDLGLNGTTISLNNNVNVASGVTWSFLGAITENLNNGTRTENYSNLQKVSNPNGVISYKDVTGGTTMLSFVSDAIDLNGGHVGVGVPLWLTNGINGSGAGLTSVIAATVTTSAGSDSTSFPLFSDAATGNNAARTDAEYQYDPTDDRLKVVNANFNTLTVTNGVDVGGNVTVVGGLEFEGATDDDFETAVAATDPTADRTVTLPDASGTVALVGGNIGAATATTPDPDDDSTRVATTAWVQDELSGVSGGGSPTFTTGALLKIPEVMSSGSALALAAADAVYVYKVTNPLSFWTTNLNYRVDTGVSSGQVGFGIYAADGNRVFHTGAVAAGTGDTGYKQVAWSGGAQLFTNGYYYFAWTGNSTTIALRCDGGAPGTTIQSVPAQVINPGDVVFGTAANSSSGGVLPATLGSLTPVNGGGIPIVAIKNK